jgi:hypothetical protein
MPTKKVARAISSAHSPGALSVYDGTAHVGTIIVSNSEYR